jgi:alcohol dehydrogenase class IV
MIDVQQGYENHLPRRVITGRGASGRLSEICRARGWSRAFVVSDRGVESAGLLARVLAPLADAGLLAGHCADVPPEPPLSDVARLVEQIRVASADVVIGLGGGSVMDAAKVAALAALRGGGPADYVGIGRAGGRGIPTILVPTTAGTGSEATSVAILTDTEAGTKVGVVDPSILADVAVVDPALTDGLPPAVTAAAGMDALVHAIEAFIARCATPIARGLALEAARQIGPALEQVCKHPDDRLARDAMATGSHLAGMAFANASCCAVHALALPLGGRFHIPHGVITGCFAGAVMRHNAPACRDDFAALSTALGWGALPPAAFAERLDATARSIGLRAALDRVVVPDAAVAPMARDAVNNRRLIDPNPVAVSEADADRIYRSVLRVGG